MGFYLSVSRLRLWFFPLDTQEDLGLQSEIVTLHTKLGGCVDMLDSFETLLDTFQADLANISDDIKTMQDQSISKNVKINNRRV